MKLISNFKFSFNPELRTEGQISNFRGFTLIELIVVFTVIAILSTIGVASLASYSQAQTLQQSSNDLITTLNTARASAISQVKPSQCLSSTLDGYSVSINLAGNSYTLNVICSGATIPLTTAKKLSSGISFNPATGTPPTTTTNVFFSLLTSGVTGSGNIVLSGYGRTRTITVSSIGGIQ